METTGTTDPTLSAVELASAAQAVTAPASRIRRGFNSFLRLLLIWIPAALLALVAAVLLYTLAISRDRTVYDEAVYEGYRLVGAPGTTQLYTWEGFGITSYGENGLVVDKELNFDVPRILFLGDSYVEAKQVSDAAKFTELVESDWNRSHPDQPVQTLNLGMAGQDIRTYISFGRNMDREFAPSKVFVMLNQQDFLPLANDPDLLAAYQADHNVKLVKPEKLSGLQEIISATPVRQFFLRLLLQTNGFRASGGGGDKTAQAELAGNTSDVLLGKEASVAAQLQALKDIWGDRLVIVYNTYIPAYGKDAPPTYEPDTLMHEAAKQNIPVVNLYGSMLNAFRTHNPPRGFQNTTLGVGHFNQTGHRVIADQVLNYLAETGMPEVTK